MQEARSVARKRQVRSDILSFPSPAEAERSGGLLVDRGLAACVNIFPGMTAIYVWEGMRQRESETAVIIKTRTALATQVVAEARKLHPYTKPGPAHPAGRGRVGGLHALDRRADGGGLGSCRVRPSTVPAPVPLDAHRPHRAS